ncbi:MAG: alanine--tRNA ligase [Patescibacteria group bacterium]|nr:alanine--tRNA ligase [Patescibacteria group bacterium]
MTSGELRQKYLDFFKTKGHAIISSASLIPENDPTILYTTAGMHPLVPFLMGEKHPAGTRLANCQKCIRTGDIEEVGDSTHHTFFEMLGNWSLGDYFKKEAILWSWEFLTDHEWLNLDKKRLAVSVFQGDQDSPFDQESFAIWKKEIGIAEQRIAKLPKKNNWWGLETGGPCGPDTEIFYWAGDADKVPAGFNDDHPLWVEIWNNVFMQYNKKAGKLEPLAKKNVDTGMGLERILAVMNGLADNYQTDLFKNIINRICQLSGQTYGKTPEIDKALRIIADHLKAATFIMADDKAVAPSNTDRGYVLRRLIRRAIRYGRQIGIVNESWTKEIAKVVAHDYQAIYPELSRNINKVIEQLNVEEGKFNKTLEQGLREFEKIIKQGSGKKISGKQAFDLYQSYGFPLEITEELAREQGLSVEVEAFCQELKKHQQLSRTASAGQFKGGLADAGAQTTKLHTAAHLLLAALRKVLGEQVVQRGSNITAERLRFDFSYPTKMTDEQKQQVENLVNQAIKDKLIVDCQEMSLAEAKAFKAHGTFESKYGERVKVYMMGNFSKEICGGPHVDNTGKLGHFKIQKEESSSAGVRRIKAILE